MRVVTTVQTEHEVEVHHPSPEQEAAGFGSVAFCVDCDWEERMLTRSGATDLAREHRNGSRTRERRVTTEVGA